MNDFSALIHAYFVINYKYKGISVNYILIFYVADIQHQTLNVTFVSAL